MEPNEPKDETLRSIGEDELIRRIAGWLTTPDHPLPALTNLAAPGFEVLTGIGDDTAIVRHNPNAPRIALTTDMLIEHVHFLPECAPEDLGWKAAASNLSDLASVGAHPLWALISLGAPAETQVDRVRDFYQGMQSALIPYGCICLGGDTVRSRDRTINLALAGQIPDGVLAPLRNRARPGQVLYVTGTLGDSGAGLKLLQEAGETGSQVSDEAVEFLKKRHLRPTARVQAGATIARLCPDAAMMDLSDGPALDLPRMARASACGFEVEIDRLPLSAALREAAETLAVSPERFALYGGEDYELLFATSEPPENWRAEVEASVDPPVRVTRIGKCVADECARVRYLNPGGGAFEAEPNSFRHF